MLAFFTNPIIWAIITTAIGWKFFHYNTQLKDQTSERFTELRTRIEGPSTRESLYKTGLTKFLAWADRFFEYGGPTTKDPSVLSASAYDRCLQMAVFYPLAAALFGWLVFGTAGELGRVIRIDDFSILWPRVLAILLIVMVMGLGHRFNNRSYRKHLFHLLAAMNIMIVGALLLLALGVSAMVITLLYITYVLQAVIGTSGIRTGNGIGIITFSVSIAAAFTLTADSNKDFIVAFPFTGAFIFGIVSIVRRQPNFLWLISASLSIFGLGFVLVSVLWKLNIDNYFSIVGLVVGFVLLPLVNVPFDFVSVALTRTLLRKNRDQSRMLWRLGYAALDLVMALVFMVLLAIVMVICLQAFDSALGTNALGVRAVLQDIAANPAAGRHFWIYFALFSTMLPTIIHAVIGVSSLISFRLAPRSWVLGKMNNLDDTARYEVASLLTLQFFASIALVALGAWGLLWLFGSMLGLSDVLLSFLLQVQAATEAILS